MVLKRNPFTPQDPVTDPKRFAGRRTLLRSGVDSLFNSKNVLITGPRGIGKSSLAYQLLYMTQGEQELLEKLDIYLEDSCFNWVTGDHRCSVENSLADIARGLVVTLAKSAQVNLPAHIQQKSSRGLNFSLLKASEETTTEPLAASDVANWFTMQVSSIFEMCEKPRSGVGFLIDEVDVLPKEVQLGSFLKASVEKFRLDGHLSICFIVGGVTGTATSLIAQHASTRRLFEHLELQEMSYDELEELVELTLEGTGVRIATAALPKMIQMANNFPQPLQLIGYHSFRLDEDGTIDIADIEDAKRYIIEYSLRRDYADKLRRLHRGKRADLIQAISETPRSTVSFKSLENSIAQKLELCLSKVLVSLPSV